MADHDSADSGDLLAAEYVLGVLSLEERHAVERRMDRDAAFAAAVIEWEERLLVWADEIPDVAPPPEVWPRLLKTLPAQWQPRAGAQAPRLSFWRNWAIGATGFAAASLVALFFVLSAPTQHPLVASIEGGGHRHFVATLDPRRAQIVVAPAAFSATADRDAELWLIEPGGKPRSLGLLDAGKPVTVALPAGVTADDRAVLAVSLEPLGGSKVGAPTGPVIAQGKLTKL